jgi:hypothetical protein
MNIELLESEITDVFLQLNDFDKYEVSVSNIEADEYSPTLGEFYFKSHALKYALELFKSIDFEQKKLVILDQSEELEIDVLTEYEEIEQLIEEEFQDGN